MNIVSFSPQVNNEYLKMLPLRCLSLCTCVLELNIHAHVIYILFCFLQTQTDMHFFVCRAARVYVRSFRSSLCRFHQCHLSIGKSWPDSENSSPFHREPSIIPHRIRKKKEGEGESSREGLLFYFLMLAHISTII